MKRKTLYLVQGAAVAALYVALTWISSLLGLASGVIQLRLSEALTILPLVLPAAVPGLFVGCLLANLLTGGVIWDVVFGAVATLLGALGTRWLSKSKWMAPVWPILANMAVVPLILQYAYHAEGSYWYFLATIGAGEILSCGVLGLLLYTALERTGVVKDGRLCWR